MLLGLLGSGSRSLGFRDLGFKFYMDPNSLSSLQHAHEPKSKFLKGGYMGIIWGLGFTV